MERNATMTWMKNHWLRTSVSFVYIGMTLWQGEVLPYTRRHHPTNNVI